MKNFPLLVFLLLAAAQTTAMAQSPQKYALLIAVNRQVDEQLNTPELAFAEADAKSLAELLSYGGYEVDLLLGKAATQLAIRAALDELDQQVPADGVVVVGIFGRGLDMISDLQSSQSAAEGYFYPVDAKSRIAREADGRILLGDGEPLTEPDPKTLISLNEILQALSQRQSARHVIFADCVHQSSPRLKSQVFATSLKATDLPPQTAVMVSCSPNQQPVEHENWRHGAFTNCLLQEMQDLYLLGSVTTGGLADRLRKDVPKLVATHGEGKHQTPRQISTGSIDLQLKKPEGRRVFVGRLAGEGKELLPGMNFHWCPMGGATMGSPGREAGRHQNEDEVEVSLTGFWIGETEITQRQWQTVMNTTPWKGKSNLHTGRIQLSLAVKEGDDYAVTYVSHGDQGNGKVEPDSATDFCQRLTLRERTAGRLPAGWKYALPTEAQWEYACRAGTKTRFSFGDDENQLNDYAWWGAKYGIGDALGNAWKEQYAHRVGLKKPNGWGLHDMHGNVWEWCADSFVEKLPGGRDPFVTSTTALRACRGGCWLLPPTSCRSAVRSGGSPDNRNSALGFRVAAVRAN